MRKQKMVMVTAFLLCVLFLSGCSEIYITNLSDFNVRVSVNTPDAGSPSIRNLRPAATVSVFSSNGGRYVVTILPDENFRKFLDELKQEISQKLMKEGAALTVEEVQRLTQRLNDIDLMVKEMQDDYGASCSGYVPDYESVTALVSWDQTLSKFTLSCSSGSSN